jgi:hypothetical protein
MGVRWARQLTEEVTGGSPVQIGKCYLHPTDGEIEVVSGQYWGTNGPSTYWHWEVLATGEIKAGYGGDWPEVSP